MQYKNRYFYINISIKAEFQFFKKHILKIYTKRDLIRIFIFYLHC